MAKAGKSGMGKPGTRIPGKKTKAKTAAPKGGGAAKKAPPRKTAARKTPAPTRTGKGKGKGKGRERTAGRIIPHTATTLLVLVGFFIMAAAGAYILLYPEISLSPLNPASSSSRPLPPVATKTSKTAKPHYEVFPVEPAPTRTNPPPSTGNPSLRGNPCPGSPLSSMTSVMTGK